MSSATVFDVTRSARKELEEIFREHYRFVYRTAYGVTGSAEDAEDILQNLFANLLRRELPPDLSKNPKAYLYRAAFNLSLNTIRDRVRHPSSDPAGAAMLPSRSDDHDELEEMDRRLHSAIAELPPETAQIVILRYVHDHSLAAIAELLGTTRGTVAVALFRARKRLKKRLQEMESVS